MAAESSETKSVKLGLNITPSEMKALEFIKRIHGDKYEGVASVLRDYSIADAVKAFEAALAEAAAA